MQRMEQLQSMVFFYLWLNGFNNPYRGSTTVRTKIVGQQRRELTFGTVENVFSFGTVVLVERPLLIRSNKIPECTQKVPAAPTIQPQNPLPGTLQIPLSGGHHAGFPHLCLTPISDNTAHKLAKYFIKKVNSTLKKKHSNKLKKKQFNWNFWQEGWIKNFTKSQFNVRKTIV